MTCETHIIDCNQERQLDLVLKKTLVIIFFGNNSKFVSLTYSQTMPLVRDNELNMSYNGMNLPVSNLTIIINLGKLTRYGAQKIT